MRSDFWLEKITLAVVRMGQEGTKVDWRQLETITVLQTEKTTTQMTVMEMEKNQHIGRMCEITLTG